MGIIYTCPECSRQVGSKTALQHHHRQKHLKKINNCDQCKSVFTLPSGLKRHIESKHASPEISLQANVKELECQTKTEQLKSPHKCDQWRSTSISELKIHKENVHGPKTYSPLKCQSDFETPIINNQEIIHKDNACLACDFRGNSIRDLHIHTDAKHDGITYGKYWFHAVISSNEIVFQNIVLERVEKIQSILLS